MPPSKPLIALSTLVAFLALIASGVGLFYQDGGAPFSFTTLHGQTVQMYGSGLYRSDTYFKAPIFRGTDAAMLLVFIPLLVYAILRYRKGSLRGKLLLAGILSVFLYNAVSMAFGTAYNNLFLVYILLFSASLFAFITACSTIDLPALAARVSPGVPRRGMAILLFVSGLSVFVWLIEIIGGLVQGQAPASLASYTTDITAVLDVGIITPVAYLAGVSLLRRAPLGYLLAPIMLILNASIAVIVISQTIFQTLAGITLNPGQFIGFVGSFVITGTFALGLVIRFLREIMPVPMARASRPNKK